MVSVELLSVDEALAHMLSTLTPVGVERMRFSDGAGRVLAADIYAGLTLPPFPNSAMDGFAVRARDLEGATSGTPVTLDVAGEVAAGDPGVAALPSGRAFAISTGAVLPAGADAVVPVEWTTEEGAAQEEGRKIRVEQPVQPGAFIRPEGQDVRQGELLLHRGRRLRSVDIGMLASIGATEIQVYRRPRVALFSSGDELLEPDQPLTPGKIHDSNRYALAAAVDEVGGEVLRLPIAPDSLEAVRSRLDEAASNSADLIISSAGVSVGEHDHVRRAVQEAGELAFWRVNLRPGKPLAFGRYQGIPFLGLPGNPVSSMVTFEIFAKPAITRLAGHETGPRLSLPVRLAEEVSSDGRESYLRAVIRRTPSGYEASLTGNQDSGILSSLIRANALLRIPAGCKNVKAGDVLDAWLIGPIEELGEEQT